MITVTSFDVLRIVEQTGQRPEMFAELVEPRILNWDNDTILECYEGKERYDYLLALRSRPCIFLKEDRCTIHAFAPYVCRLYPHRSDDGKVTPRALCPALAKIAFMLKKPGVDVEEYQNQMHRHKEIVRRWNRKKGRKEDCLDFLMEESKQGHGSVL